MTALVRILPLVVPVAFGFVAPCSSSAEPRKVTLPPLEVPDKPRTSKFLQSQQERSDLLLKPVELSNAGDRIIVNRQNMKWESLISGICAGCAGNKRTAKVSYIDPIAVLNATHTTTTTVTRNKIRVAHVYWPKITRPHHRGSRVYAYYRRLRDAALKWRRDPRHRSKVARR